MAPDLASLGEDRLIQLLCRLVSPGPGLLVGPGDDCAVLASASPAERLLFKTDAMVEGVHFTPDTSPLRVGWKAAARAVSDFAAMGGGEPRHALITLFTPSSRPSAWLEDLYRGLQRCAARYGFGLAGGETCQLPPHGPGCIISVSLLGNIPADRCLLRSGARAGDAIWVTGTLGGSFETGKHLDFEPRLAEARALAATGTVHAMMDLSDGLAKDLPRLARASQAGFRLDQAAIPITPGFTLHDALTGGEDYELLFTLPPETTPPQPLCTRIGTIVPAEESDQLSGGWDHFSSSSWKG